MTHTAPGAPPLELVVETLTPTAAPTIIAVDGHPKAWVPLHNFRNVRNRLVADEVRSVVSTVRESAEPVDRVLPRWRGQRARVLARPVVSFSGAVHAVQLWVGDADTDTPGPAAPVAAIEWSARSHRIELNTQCVADRRPQRAPAPHRRRVDRGELPRHPPAQPQWCAPTHPGRIHPPRHAPAAPGHPTLARPGHRRLGR